MLDIESQKSPKGRWPTPPFDPRFPNQNQTRNCYQNFLGETLRAKLGGGRETEKAGRGPSHLRTGRGSRTGLGGGDGWGVRGKGHGWKGRGLLEVPGPRGGPRVR